MKEMAYGSGAITEKLNELVASQQLYMGLMFFGELGLPEQALIGTWELAAEVYNGGFTQYFHNSSGAHAKPMVQILSSIGADRAAAILESAIVLAGPSTRWGNAPNFLTALNSMPADVKRQLEELESNLYEETDNLYLQLFRYLSKHHDLIDAPADFWTEPTIQ
jgi:hypothetical protein